MAKKEVVADPDPVLASKLLSAKQEKAQLETELRAAKENAKAQAIQLLAKVTTESWRVPHYALMLSIE